MLEALAAIIKGLSYIAAFVAVGTVIARASLEGNLVRPSPGPTSLIWWAGIALTLAACGTAALFFIRLGGNADSTTLDAIFLSKLGVAFALQLIGGLWIASFAGRPIAVLGTALILLSFGVVGHSASRGLLTSLTIVLHVAGAAWWFGGLFMLLLASRASDVNHFPTLIARFSRQAVWIVGLLLVAALGTASLLVEWRFDASLGYQQGLLTKLGLTAFLLALAGVNKLVLTPRLAGPGTARLWLRRMIAAELLLFLAIMATTAYLTTYLSPHDRNDSMHGSGGQVRASGPIDIIAPWAPAMPKGARTAAGYMEIANNQMIEDRLVAASSPWAEHVTLHASNMDNGIVRMREIAALPIPADMRITLRPGVFHLMFTDLYTPFVAGDTVPLTLIFERAGKVEVTLHVRPLGGGDLGGHGH
ncbi:hypothetical protein ASE85_18670 [Sphingobium sp. Leaf26]|uniref:copper chaperone PCu(A)C n=1 Tax=Sphingobium sp. Leaf26 TaxID=1735693 RepID=UPI0006FCAE23|nr:copper chaperone PCu(A)C [Sphingobium sp. Leaf26]KQN07103.1 hypothetical protein ASE85_18670 [Sphingobium sp. Leaf26]